MQMFTNVVLTFDRFYCLTMKYHVVLLVAAAALPFVAGRRQSRDHGALDHEVVGRISSERNQLGVGINTGSGNRHNERTNSFVERHEKEEPSVANEAGSDGGTDGNESGVMRQVDSGNDILNCVKSIDMDLYGAFKTIREALRREGTNHPGGLTHGQLTDLIDCLEHKNIVPIDALRALEGIVHHLKTNPHLIPLPSKEIGPSSKTNPSRSTSRAGHISKSNQIQASETMYPHSTTISRTTTTNATTTEAPTTHARSKSVANVIQKEQNSKAEFSKTGTFSKY
ncbi:uncharacterized protein LOC111259219 isoform X1 [Varroa jacobsoni]|uniref:uncharacterized protein LOC111259219 isoform X1 n=1 Tax=Varroa jacobsoni TaxID=62625 RepID=UPI000BFA2BA7|nr:uncharacterized protein LOC111259219 isoform X1 [Varroa jacobsoni]